jgi:hypothetical protein
MGFLRFRRTFRIGPGLRLNLSKSGVSASVGRRGLWFTAGPRGTRATVGIPGTGLSYTELGAPLRAVSAPMQTDLAGIQAVTQPDAAEMLNEPETASGGSRTMVLRALVLLALVVVVVLAIAIWA